MSKTKESKSQTKKVKIVRNVTPPPTAVGTYKIERLIHGQWVELETVKAKNRRSLVKQLTVDGPLKHTRVRGAK